MSEHQLRVQRSLQKLDIPEWYKSSAVSQTPQGFLLKRNSESRKENQGWPGLGSKTTSLSSLGSSHSAAARSSTGKIFFCATLKFKYEIKFTQEMGVIMV